MRKLSKEDRLRLMKFVCSFVWADLRVHDKEKDFVRRMVEQLDLDPKEAAQVEAWLRIPPPPQEVDPTKIPAAHRDLFLKTAREVIMADGEMDPEEQINLALLEELIR
jgi:uncharacterized tellurite resistance protein B-like protein